jgi:hypothetical protein
MLAGQSRTIYAEKASGRSNPKTSQKGRPIAVGRSFAFLSRSFCLPANVASLKSLPILSARGKKQSEINSLGGLPSISAQKNNCLQNGLKAKRDEGL